MPHPMLSLLSLLFAVANAPATAPTSRPAYSAEKVVGTVLGKPITAGDVQLTELTAPIDVTLKFTASDEPYWSRMHIIGQKFRSPLIQRLVADKKLILTDDEFAAFKKKSAKSHETLVKETGRKIAEIDDQLKTLPAGDPKRKELETDRERHQKFAATMSAPEEDANLRAAAEMMIVGWKAERELFRTYGGRVIFQQFGLEAIDASRKFYEDAEHRGDLTFSDPAVRHLFYYYYLQVDHSSNVTDDKDPFAKNVYLEPEEEP